MQLRTSKRGVPLRLYPLEKAVMEVMWNGSLASFAVADVHGVLKMRGAIAYTTVMTTMGRLFNKGLLVRVVDGRRYLYSPVYTREQFLTADAGEITSAGDRVVALLAQKVTELSADELDTFERVIRMRRDALGI